MLNRTLSDQALNPPYTQAAATTESDTSEGWLRNPAWIDGGLDPPKYYYSHEEIDTTCCAYGVIQPPPFSTQEPTATADPSHRMAVASNNSAMDTTSASPAILLTIQYDILSARVSPTPRNNYYREVEVLGHWHGMWLKWLPTYTQSYTRLNKGIQVRGRKQRREV
ncbi:hypothetical protein JOM56_000836 [Amanita muscaria]